MKEKDLWAKEWCEEFAKQLPGMFDHTEGVRCFLAGFQFAKEKLMDLCDSKHQVVGFTEINRLGEKTIK